MIDTVVCFDRDYTVNVNAYEDKEAVPLALVKRLAHSTDNVHVWAIGNLHLKREARIPGIDDAVPLWEEHNSSDVFDTYSRSTIAYSERLARSDRLRVIHDLYRASELDHDSIAFLVIDDIDLTELEPEWEHYTAWDFMPRVRDGEFSFTDSVGEFNDTGANSEACTDPSHDQPIQVPESLII